jgi:DNA repair exonuclease SbcCD nuclease subunit
MTIAMLSDVHLSSHNPICRKDDLRVTQWNKLNWVYTKAFAAGCKAVVLAGDLVDIACSWSLLPELAAFLRKYSQTIMTMVVFGQHDTYMYSVVGRKKTIIGAMEAAGLLTVLGSDPVEVSAGIRLHGASYGQELPKPDTKRKGNLLVIHAPISDRELWVGQSYYNANDFLWQAARSFDGVICGDIHRAFYEKIGKRFIINTGPLLRRKSDEGEHKPHFYIVGKDLVPVKVEIPHEPADKIISREHIEKERAYDQLINQLQSSKPGKTGTDVRFADILAEVVLKNTGKTNTTVMQLLADITGINVEVARGKEKPASRQCRTK